MVENKQIREPARPASDPSYQEKGGYISPATPIGQLPTVPEGAAPGATPSGQAADGAGD